MIQLLPFFYFMFWCLKGQSNQISLMILGTQNFCLLFTEWLIRLEGVSSMIFKITKKYFTLKRTCKKSFNQKQEIYTKWIMLMMLFAPKGVCFEIRVLQLG